jgi:hypothetical protein
MAYILGKSNSFINLLEKLYNNEIFINNLNEIKTRMRGVHQYARPQFDDIEAEIVCLILMHLNPKNICEFSPCGGWSTIYMLNSLELMQNTECKLVSFDIQDVCTANISRFSKITNQWKFYLGNVEDNYPNFNENIDYLFIDSDHTSGFAKKYVNELLEPLLVKLKAVNKKVFVSVHDVFHSNVPSEEGEVVIEFLQKHNIEYFSPLNDFHRIDIAKFRNNANLDKTPVHYATTNPCIFFILG